MPRTIEHVTELVTLFAYDPTSAPLVLAAKNGGRRDLLAGMGRALGAALVSSRTCERRHDVSLRSGDGALDGVLDDAIDDAIVTWVPAHPDNVRARGFDQGRVVAAAAGRSLRRPVVELIERRGHAQRGRDRAGRLDGPLLVAVPRARQRLRRAGGPGRRSARIDSVLGGRPVVLVDDVVTTGASLTAAARLLGDLGAGSITAAVIASVDPVSAGDGVGR